MLKNLCLLFVFLIVCTQEAIQAGIVFRNGRMFVEEELATMSMQEHFERGAIAINEEDWGEAAFQFKIITVNFPTTIYGQEALFYLGVAEYYMAEYDMANNSFNNYLSSQGNPRFFQEVIEFKYAIAEKLAAGSKRRFLGTKKLPKWACGKDLAIEIYDEVIAAVPCHEIAAFALISKGYLQWTMRLYQEAIDSFQMAIRRFPKHELAPECYVYIAEVYLEQSYYEYQNSDLLAFSEINLSRFEKDYPRESRVELVRQLVKEVKEIYANGLYQTGRFYERTYHTKAALIYYYNTMHQFPGTEIAALSRDRIACLDINYCDPYDDSDEVESPEEEVEEEEPRSQNIIEHRQQLGGS
jgi:outer membrane protein assembly factor BamD (BamD/ComL family)